MKLLKISSLSVVFICSILLMSCKTSSNTSINNKTQDILKFDTISNIRLTVDDIQKKVSNNQYQNLKFSEDYLINIPNVKDVCSIYGQYGINTTNEIFEYASNVARYCYGNDIDVNNLVEKEFAIVYNEKNKLLFVNKEKTSFEYISESMFDFDSTYLTEDITLGLSNLNEEDVAINKATDLLRTYKAKENTFMGRYVTTIKEDIPDIKFNIGGTEVSILEAKTFAEKFYNDLPKLYEWYNYICNDISVYKLDNQEYIYLINMSASYNDLPIDNTNSSYSDSITNTTTSKFFTGINESCILIDIDDNKPELIRNYIVGIELTNTENPVEKIISLEYVMEDIQNLMSKYVDFNIESIELIYSCIYDNKTNEFIFQPSWKIKGTPYTDCPSFSTNIFINAITGEETILAYPDLQR